MSVEKVIVQVSVLEGADLVAKDKNIFGKKTTSDPYCEVWKLSESPTKVGTTRTVYKSLSPKWPNNTFIVEFREKECRSPHILLKVFDEDKFSADDAMGNISIRVPAKQGISSEWYDIPPESAKNASGRLHVRFDTSFVYSKSLIRGNEFPLQGKDYIQVGLAWDMLPGRKAVDLDLSCVSLSKQGDILMDDTVYYGNQSNSNESVLHSGDEQVGDDEGDDEKITFEMRRIPENILCMYILVTVATPGMRIPDIQSTTMRVYDTKQRYTLCRFTPAQNSLSVDATAMFMVRIGRENLQSKRWVLSTIEDTHPTARDFGSLLPYFKSYTRDLLPTIEVDPTERVAIMRKGGNVRLSDYLIGGSMPNRVTFGLAWDITDGVKVDFDASVVCLDAELNLEDIVYFKQLRSQDGSIVHYGDEREGDKIGDDERLDIFLGKVSSSIHYIGFVINSYSGQELDDVDRAFCHLFDPQTGTDIVSYAMSNSQSLDGYTALIVGCLYRGASPGEWCFRIISEPSMGKVVKENVNDLKTFLRRNPPGPPTMEIYDGIIESTMPMIVPLADDDIDLSISESPGHDCDIDVAK